MRWETLKRNVADLSAKEGQGSNLPSTNAFKLLSILAWSETSMTESGMLKKSNQSIRSHLHTRNYRTEESFLSTDHRAHTRDCRYLQGVKLRDRNIQLWRWSRENSRGNCRVSDSQGIRKCLDLNKLTWELKLLLNLIFNHVPKAMSELPSTLNE